eukprot:gene1727-3345_t
METQSNSQLYDCIVVGLGAHGSAAIAHLAKRHLKVLGIEQFTDIHSFGSSHGKSRIIRQAYFEDPRYVPLLRRSFQLWRDLEKEYNNNNINNNNNDTKEHNTKLLHITGGLMIGAPTSPVIQGTLHSVRTHSLPHEMLTAMEINQRYPVFTPSEHEIGIYETEAGYLIPEQCNLAHQYVARNNGAELHFNEAMISWEEKLLINNNNSQSQSNSDDLSSSTTTTNNNSNNTVLVSTTAGTYLARKLVLAVGPWAPEVYGDSIPVNVKLHVERRVLYWFDPVNSDSDGNDSISNSVSRGRQKEQFKDIPVYIWDLNQNGKTTEIEDGVTSITTSTTSSSEEVLYTSPSTISREVFPEEIEAMRGLLQGRIPFLAGGKLLEYCTSADVATYLLNFAAITICPGYLQISNNPEQVKYPKPGVPCGLSVFSEQVQVPKSGVRQDLYIRLRRRFLAPLLTLKLVFYY